MQNPLIDVSYSRMMHYLRLLRLDRKFTSPIILRTLRTLREHVEILNACNARNADVTEAALQAHLRAATQRNIGFM